MSGKRSSSGSSKAAISHDTTRALFDLDDDRSAKFWTREDALHCAENAIEQEMALVGDVSDIVPMILTSMKNYTIKLYSSAIKAGTVSTSTIFSRFLMTLETYDTTVNDDDHLIKQYLIQLINVSINVFII